MKSKQVTIGGVQVHLAFDLLAWFDVEDAFDSMDAMREKLLNNKKPVSTLVELLAIEANAGERSKGKDGHFTAEWMKKNLKPWQVTGMIEKAYEALADGLEREECENSDDVDVVAEQLAKKRTADA